LFIYQLVEPVDSGNDRINNQIHKRV